MLSLEPPLPHLDKQLVLCMVLAKFHLLSNLPPSSKSPGTSGAACSSQASLVQTPVGHLCSSTNHSVPTAPRLLKSDVQEQYPSYPLCLTKLKKKSLKITFHCLLKADMGREVPLVYRIQRKLSFQGVQAFLGSPSPNKRLYTKNQL